MAIGDGGWFLCPPNVTLPLLFVPRVVSAVRWLLNAKNQAREKNGECETTGNP